MKVPFVVYADFEAFTEEIASCEPNNDESFTNTYQRHKPSGFCYKIVCFEEKNSQKPILYRAKNEDEDIGEKFIEIVEDIKKIYKKFNFPKRMIFTEKDKSEYEKATLCWICQQEFGESGKNVRDHCHFTGKYRRAAHNKCNLQFKKTKFLPVIFHNLSGYDSHLFVKNLGKSEVNNKCIPNNEEKYISFSKDIVVGKYKNMKGKIVEVKNELRFIDSFKFMASSLDSLVGNLTKSGLEKLKETKKIIKSSCFQKEFILTII